MKKKTLILLLLLLLLLLRLSFVSEQGNSSVPAEKTCPSDPFPSELIDTSGLYQRITDPDSEEAKIVFRARNGNLLRAYTYRATGFSETDGQIVFVMHGAARNADTYIRKFKHIAERHGVLAIALEFTKSLYGPGSEHYTLGVGTKGTPYGDTYNPLKWVDRNDYIYSEIEHIFEAVKSKLVNKSCSYLVWGHSAGGQFTHRLMTFRSDARVASAVSANAGFYTLPSYGGGKDKNYFMPYGLQGTSLSDKEVEKLLSSPLVVLVGENDRETGEESKSVRNSSAANFQGKNRHERAIFYYETGKREALRRNVNFGWSLGIVPGVNHNTTKIAPSAGWYLFHTPGESPCTSSAADEARGLVINEIHADPANGIQGDANNDGIRDAASDEFVELVNNSNKNLCLTGWTLTDADSAARHSFPVGSLLRAGQALIVFGGGVPTGNFGGAIVQNAVFGSKLSLTNKGDILTLSDAQKTILLQISWGDCDSRTCAMKHIDHELNTNVSFNRWPEISGPFLPHRSTGTVLRYSPGVRVNGTPFG